MSKPKPFRSLCVFVMVLLLGVGAMPAFAQSQASTGEIVGSVTDKQGAAISDATVTVKSTQTGLEQSARTNTEGFYRVSLLPPGIYTMTVEAKGFANATISNVEVTVGRSVTLNSSLDPSGVQEVVNVTAGAIQVQTTRSEADAVLNQNAIDNLPINGRRFHDFITLTPTALVEPSRNQISLAGQRGINSNVNVDGVDYNQPFFGGIRGGERSNNAYTVPQESIKEFQVVASGYTAEFGRSTGGIVNAVTKSGTNSFHGSAFFLDRPQEVSKDTNWFSALRESFALNKPPAPTSDDVVPAPTQQQWGGSFGGPIKKDKLFFFGAYEQQRFRNPRFVFFDSLNSFTPSPASQEAFDFFKSQQVPFTQTNDAKAGLVRADYEINQNHRFNIRYSQSSNNALNANATGNSLLPTTVSALSNNGTEQDRSYTVVGQLASFFSPTLINELRGQWSREDRPRPANALQPLVSSGVGNFGTVSFLGQNQEFDWRLQFADGLTWSKGQHTFKFGGEYNHVYIDQLFGFNQFGTFSISGSVATAAGVESILAVMSKTPTHNRFDNPSSVLQYFHQIGNLQAAYATNELAFFGQDSWRVRPNLTINYGLRWEGQFNPDPELGDDALINLVKDGVYPSGHRPDPSQIPDDLKQFGPRFGIAWDPWGDGKTVVRGYAGVYNARTPLLLLAGPFNNFRTVPGDLSVTLPFKAAPGNPNASANTIYKQLKLIGIDLNNFSLDQLPIVTVDQIRQLAELMGIDPDVAGITLSNPIMMASDYRNPRSYQAGFGVEHQLGKSITVGADYTYVNTVYLERNRDVNIPAPIIRSTDPAMRPFFGLRSGTARPVPQLNQVQIRESTARANYQAFTARFKVQRHWGQFSAYYTLSRNLSDDDNERDAGGVKYENAFDLASEYNYSNLDRRHVFVANPVFFLPLGIDLSSAIRLLSGRPVDPTAGIGIASDANEDRGGSDRPFAAPGIPFLRNSFRNRALYFFDLRGQKRINLGESRRLIFSVELFNAFNLDNIELSGTQVTNYCSSPTPATDFKCGFFAPTNPNFLSLNDNNPNSGRRGSLLLNNNPGAPFQMQFGARFQF